MSLLAATGIVAGYGAQDEILKGVDLAVGKGEIVGIIGPNGAGKSTLLKAIAGLLRLKVGTVMLDGRDITGLPAREISRLGLAYVPQEMNIFPTMSVRENLVMASRAGPDGRKAWTYERVLATFPRLTERLAHGGQQLSGGEQQVLSIGRALMTNPTLLILDEATEGLAPLIRHEIWKVLRKLKAAGQSILIVDKNLKVLARLADRHYVLERGRVRWSGDSQALGSEYEAIRRFVGV